MSIFNLSNESIFELANNLAPNFNIDFTSTCESLILSQMKQLGMPQTQNSLTITNAMITMIARAAWEISQHDNGYYTIAGYSIGVRRNSGFMYDNMSLLFDGETILQLNEDCEGWHILYANVNYITADPCYQSIIVLAAKLSNLI